MYLADWLPTRSEDASGQVDVLFFVVIVVREARGRAIAAVAIFVFLFGTEAKKSQGTLKIKDRLFENASAFLLCSKESRNPYSAGRNSIERILTLESNNVIINYYNYN